MTRPQVNAYPYGIAAASFVADGTTETAADTFANVITPFSDAAVDLLGDYDWQTVSAYASGWSAYNDPNFGPGAQFRRVGQHVHLQGLIVGGTGTIFTLPVGYRAAYTMPMIANTNGGMVLLATYATGVVGAVAVSTGASVAGYMSLAGCSFFIGA